MTNYFLEQKSAEPDLKPNRAELWSNSWDVTQVPMSCVRVQILTFLPVQLPAEYPGRQQVMGRISEFLSPTWKTWMGFQTPGFSLHQPQLLQAFGNDPVNRTFLSSSFFVSMHVTLYFKQP